MRTVIVPTLSLCLCILTGCGESTQDKVLRMAQARAAANKLNAEEEAEAEAEALAAANAAAPPVAEPVAAEGTPAPPASSTPAPEAPAVDAAAVPAPPASPEATEMPADPPEQFTSATAQASLPHRDRLLSFTRWGDQVAYTGDSQVIGVFDVVSKSLVRQVYNPLITPFSISFDASGKHLAVGGLDGTFKMFSLESTDGLDDFQRNRARRRDAEAPRKGHEHPVTATSVTTGGDLVVTGDSSGMLKLWSGIVDEPLELTSTSPSLLALRSYQNDEVLLGAGSDNRLMFWMVGKKQLEAKPFPDGEIPAKPTVLTSDSGNKGIMVGDEQGRVTMWLPDGEKLVRSSFKAHDEPIVGLGVVNGQTLLTASADGDVHRWSLPIAELKVIKTVDQPRWVSRSSDGQFFGVPNQDKNLDLYRSTDAQPLRRHTLQGSSKLTSASLGREGELTFLGDSDGRIHFQDENRRLVAIANMGPSPITAIERSPDQNSPEFAVTQGDGTLILATMPELRLSRSSAMRGELVASNRPGTWLVTSRGSQVTLIDATTASPTNTARIDSAKVTALDVDDNLAIIGSSTGDVWVWPYLVKGASPEILAKAVHSGAIVSIGATTRGQVWSCDSEGQNRLTAMAGQRKAETQSMGVKASDVAVNSVGDLLAIDSAGKLHRGNVAKPGFEEVASIGSATIAYERIIAGSRRFAALSTTSDEAIVLDSNGQWLGRIRGRGQSKPSALVGLGWAGETLLASDATGSLVAMLPSQTAVQNQQLSESISRVVVSMDGQSMFAMMADRKAFLTAASGGSSITLPTQTVPLAIDNAVRNCVASRGDRVVLLSRNGSEMLVSGEFSTEVSGATAAAISSDGTRCIVALPNGQLFAAPLSKPGEAKLWTTLPMPVDRMQFTPSGQQLLAVGSNGRVVVVKTDDASIRYDSGQSVFAAVGPSGEDFYLGTGDGQISVLSDGAQSPRPIEVSSGDGLIRLAISDDQLVMLRKDGSVVMWSTTTGWKWEMQLPKTEANVLAWTCINAGSKPGTATTVRRMTNNGQWHSMDLPKFIALDSDWNGLGLITGSSDGDAIAAIAKTGKVSLWRRVGMSFEAVVIEESIGPASDIAAIPGRESFLVSAADGGMLWVMDHQGRSTQSIKAPITIKRIEGISQDQTAVVSGSDQSGGSVKSLVVQLGSKSFVDVRDDIGVDGEPSEWLPAQVAGQSKWLILRKGGELIALDSPMAIGGQAEFKTDTAATKVALKGELMAMATDAGVRMISPSGQTVGQASVTDATVVCLEIDPPAQRVAFADKSGAVRLVNADGSNALQIRTPFSPPNSLAWSPDSRYLAISDGSRVIVAETEAGEVVCQMAINDRKITLTRWSADGIWFLDSGGVLDRMRVPATRWRKTLESELVGLAWTKSSSAIVTATKIGTILQFSASGNETSRSLTSGGELQSMTSLGGGESFAFLGSDSGVTTFAPGKTPIRLQNNSALGIRSIVGDGSGRWLIQSNDLGQVFARDLRQPDAPLQALPCEINAGPMSLLGGDRLLVASGDQNQAALVDVNMRRTNLDPTLGRLSDFKVLPDGSFGLAVERSGGLSMIPISAGNRRNVSMPDMVPMRVAVHPTGTRVAVVGRSSKDANKYLLELIDTVELKRLAKTDLPSEPMGVELSADGSLLGVSFPDGSVNVYDSSSASLLESLAAAEDLTTFSFTRDNRRLLMAGKEGQVTVAPISVRGRVRASKDAIVSLSFHGADKYLLCATLKGDVTIWNRAALEAPQARFKAPEANLLAASVSLDGKFVVAVFDDAANSTLVWDMTSATSTAAIEPKLVIQSTTATTAAAFTSDSRFLVIGGEDGLIRAWSIDENREVAKFAGHEGPIASISPLKEKGRFVSGGVDRSIRSWRFPGSLPAPGATIPDGDLSDATQVADLKEPADLAAVDKDDPWEEARQALITGSNDDASAVQVLDLIEASEREKQATKVSLQRVLESEQQTSDDETLSKQRRDLVINRRRMAPEDESQNLSSYSDGYSNLYFVANTNFKFGIDQFRPIQLLFAERFLYAARPSSGNPPPVDEDGNPIDVGDNGALLSWDYRYSQLQAHAWSLENLNAQKLYDLPNASGVFTVPQMMLFNQDGSSRQFPTVESWATTDWPDQDRQFLAVGVAGDIRRENDILKIFQASDLLQESVRPVSQYRSFEGVVTAMAFANTMPRIAFCIRERSVHRLFLADIETLSLQMIEEVQHTQPWVNSDDEGIQRNSDASPGVTTLEFSPDDSLLLSHGQYNEEDYRFIGWRIDEEGKLENPKPKFDLKRESAFFAQAQPAVWFIDSSLYGRKTTASRGSLTKLVVQMVDGFGVVNLGSGLLERKIPFLATQHGQPLFQISDNGRWIIMGDDKGMAFIWDAMTGQRFTVTIRPESEEQLRAAGKPIRGLPEQPAHSGPIVGVGLSEPDGDNEFPAFAATFGEENKLKVWELYPIIGLQSEVLGRKAVVEEVPVSTR